MTVTPQDIFGSSPKSVLNKPFMHVQDQKPSGTDGGTSVDGANDRDLNTVLVNEISSASLANNEVTLPAGTYYIEAYGVGRGQGGIGVRAKIRDAVSDTPLLLGAGPLMATNYGVVQHVAGQLTFSTPTTIKLTTLNNVQSNTGLGSSVDDGSPEVYSDLRIWKLDSDIETPVISDPTLTLARPLMHVEYEELDNVGAKAHGATGWEHYPLNAVRTNEIAGASLGSEMITLPAGTYDIAAWGKVFKAAYVKLGLLDDGDNVLKVGSWQRVAQSSTNHSNTMQLDTRIVLASQTTIKLSLDTEFADTNTFGGTGESTPSGENNIFAGVKIYQLDAVNKQPVLVNDKLFPLPGGVIVTGNMHGLEYAYKDTLTVTVQPGICMDSTNENVLQLSIAQDVAIPAGNVDTVFNLFLTDDAETVKFDTDVNGANLPAQDKRRWIGYVLTNGSGDIYNFSFKGDTLYFLSVPRFGASSGTISNPDMSPYVPLSRQISGHIGGYASSSSTSDRPTLSIVQGTTQSRARLAVLQAGVAEQYTVTEWVDLAEDFAINSVDAQPYLYAVRLKR